MQVQVKLFVNLRKNRVQNVQLPDEWKIVEW